MVAIDVENRAAQYSQQQFSGSTGTPHRNARRSRQAAKCQRRNGDSGYREQLQVGKREVEHGGVRVRSRVIEKPVEEHLRLREERVVVNRRPVNREVTSATRRISSKAISPSPNAPKKPSFPNRRAWSKKSRSANASRNTIKSSATRFAAPMSMLKKSTPQTTTSTHTTDIDPTIRRAARADKLDCKQSD
jgi:hypothetical protein